MILQFDKERITTENVLESSGSTFSLFEVVPQECLENETTEAAGRCDNPIVVPLEQLPIQPRFIVVALKVCQGGELYQVLVTLRILSEEGQVVVELLASLRLTTGVVDLSFPGRPLQARIGGHIRFDANNRIYTLLFTLLIEVQDPIHVSMVGYP